MTSNSLTRMTGATALGAVITALVLYLMQSLIQSDGAGVEARPLGPTLTFIPVIEEQFPETTRRLPPQPLPPDLPPPLPPRLIEKTTGGSGHDRIRPPAGGGSANRHRRSWRVRG